MLLERITKSVHRLNEALLELDRSVVEINNHNQAITIVAELSEAVSRFFWHCRLVFVEWIVTDPFLPLHINL